MSTVRFSHEEIVREAKFSPEDMAKIQERRQDHTRLGFAYQLAFVRLAHRFPVQQPLEIINELLTYVGVQLDVLTENIEDYQQRQPTMAEQRLAVLDYLGLRRFGESEIKMLEEFLFAEACRLEQTGPLMIQAKQFLKESGILFPADDTLRRLIVRQRQAAREHIYSRVADTLSSDFKEQLDGLLTAGDNRLTPFQSLKQPPGKASPKAMLRLVGRRTIFLHTPVCAYLIRSA